MVRVSAAPRRRARVTGRVRVMVRVTVRVTVTVRVRVRGLGLARRLGGERGRLGVHLSKRLRPDLVRVRVS